MKFLSHTETRMKGFISSKINDLTDFFASGSAQIYSIVLVLLLISLVPVLVLANNSSVNQTNAFLGNQVDPSYSPTNVATSETIKQMNNLIGAVIQKPLENETQINQAQNLGPPENNQSLENQSRRESNPSEQSTQQNQSQQNSTVSIPENTTILENKTLQNQTQQNETGFKESQEINQTEIQNKSSASENETINQTINGTEKNETTIQIPEINETKSSEQVPEQTQETNKTQQQNQTQENETESDPEIPYDYNQVIVTQKTTQKKIIIGKPVEWVIEYELFNPTNQSILNYPLILNLPEEATNVEVVE